jgi:hypothetical protein
MNRNFPADEQHRIAIDSVFGTAIRSILLISDNDVLFMLVINVIHEAFFPHVLSGTNAADPFLRINEKGNTFSPSGRRILRGGLLPCFLCFYRRHVERDRAVSAAILLCRNMQEMTWM